MVEQIIDKYYSDNSTLKNILIQHSKSVAEKAVSIALKHPELNVDIEFIRQAAMLHDIGIVFTDAPGIFCFGSEPYICHGLLGGEILRKEGLPQHARVAERHTGTGITIENIKQQNLPLPLNDYSPETIEEQIICYADKFFSKTRLEHEKTIEQAIKSVSKFGQESVDRMLKWISMLG